MLQKIVNFVHELYNTNDFVPLSVPKFIGNEKTYLNECIDTTFVSSVGKFVDRFENDMAAFTGAKRAVVCVSGTLNGLLTTVNSTIFNAVFSLFIRLV